MLQETIIPIIGLEPSTELDLLQIGDFFLSTSDGFVQGLFSADYFVNAIGNIAHGEILKRPRLITMTHDELQNSVKNLGWQNGYLAAFLHVLWLIKDNAIFTQNGYLVIKDVNRVDINTRQFMISNCKGEYNKTTFTRKEIEEAIEYQEIINSIATNHDASYDKPEENKPDNAGHVLLNPINLVPYNVHNRLFRAWMFLTNARSTSTLPNKIASYMAVLECLFTNDNTEVNHKVAERAAFYMYSTKDERIGVFKTIKDGYNVRSKYLHGMPLDRKHSNREALLSISEKVDGLLRAIFIKIFKNDVEIFKSEDANEFFTDLIFSNYADPTINLNEHES